MGPNSEEVQGLGATLRTDCELQERRGNGYVTNSLLTRKKQIFASKNGIEQR